MRIGWSYLAAWSQRVRQRCAGGTVGGRRAANLFARLWKPLPSRPRPSPISQDEAATLWTEHLGPFLRQKDTARLLGRTAEGIAGDPGLLSLTTGSGRVVYPYFQFTGNAVLPGLPEVLEILGDTFTPWTTASWFQSPDAHLGGRTPTEALRDGDIDVVLRLARRLRGPGS